MVFEGPVVDQPDPRVESLELRVRQDELDGWEDAVAAASFVREGRQDEYGTARPRNNQRSRIWCTSPSSPGPMMPRGASFRLRPAGASNMTPAGFMDGEMLVA